MARDEIKEENNGTKNNRAINNSWVYGLLAAIVLLLVFIAGVTASSHRHEISAGVNTRPMMKEAGFRVGAGDGPGTVRVSGGRMFTSGNSVEGVVISVNGNSFVVAGHGSTTNVTTTSSTQYNNGNQVKVNDTVFVSGTTNSGVLTATDIAINP